VLEALGEEPRDLKGLQQLVGVYDPTMMRRHLRPLAELKAVIRHPLPDSRGSEYELGPAGVELREVGRLTQGWLAASPEGQIALGSVVARGAIKALVEGWSSKIIRALVARPRCLTDLDALIPTLSYPALDRRLSALRDHGLVEAQPKRERSTPYAPSRWLRRAGGPLMAATQWESQYAASAVTGERFDFETVFMLGALGRKLPDRAEGRCRLGVEFRDGSGNLALIGVQLKIVEGKVLACAARPEGEADASASGSPTAWVRALTAGDPAELYLSGDPHLTREVIQVLRHELFGSKQAA